MSGVITNPSICIPRTLNNVSRRDVKEIFEKLLGRGTVDRVDIVPYRDDENKPFCRIFVHLRYWSVCPNIMQIRQQLLGGKTIKLVYDYPWFWKCSASRSPKPEKDKTAPYIEGIITLPIQLNDPDTNSSPFNHWDATLIPKATEVELIVESAAIESVAVESAAIESVAVESVAVETAAVNSADVESVAVESDAVESDDVHGYKNVENALELLSTVTRLQCSSIDESVTLAPPNIKIYNI